MAEATPPQPPSSENDPVDIFALAGIARDTLAPIQSLERIATAHQTRLDGDGKRIDDPAE